MEAHPAYVVPFLALVVAQEDLLEDKGVSQMEAFQGGHLDVEVSILEAVASFLVGEAFLEDQVVVEAYQVVVACQAHLAKEVEAYQGGVDNAHMAASVLSL